MEVPTAEHPPFADGLIDELRGSTLVKRLETLIELLPSYPTRTRPAIKIEAAQYFRHKRRHYDFDSCHQRFPSPLSDLVQLVLQRSRRPLNLKAWPESREGTRGRRNVRPVSTFGVKSKAHRFFPMWSRLGTTNWSQYSKENPHQHS